MITICGIGGITSANPFSFEKGLMAVRLIESLHRRGEDAFGYFYKTEDGGITIHKEPGTIWQSPKLHSLAETLQDERAVEFWCHTRLATQGNSSKNVNNHPFEFKNFIMAHNGVFYRTDEFDNPTNIETDSFWALYWLAQEYSEHKPDMCETTDDGMEHVMGAFAIWLYNKEDETTYLFRMNAKPTKVAVAQEKDALILSSDMQGLNDAFGEERRDIFFRLKNMGKVGSVRPFMVYALKEGNYEKLCPFTPVYMPVNFRRTFREQYAKVYQYNTSIPGVI